MRWDYELQTGIRLRAAIEGENYELVLSLLLESYEEIIKHFIDIDIIKAEDYIDEYNYYTDNIQELIELQTYDEDSINYELDNLYDLCDSNNIFIPIC